MAATGLAWLFLNFGTIPQYGDTGEYIALSRTLKVDQYRGVAYPALIRAAAIIGNRAGLSFSSILYVFQIVLLVVLHTRS